MPPPIKHEEITKVAEVLLFNYYGGRKFYSLETETGAIREQVAPKHQNDILPAAGLGAFRTVGLFRHRHKIFIALYADQQIMLMRIGSLVFDWADPTLRVKREAIAPYVKR